MLVLGLVVIAVGAILVILGVFATDLSGDTLELAGIGVSPMALFLVGLVAGACILFGLSLTKWGAKRELKHRQERKEMDELAEKLDRAEAHRRKDLDEDQA